MILNTFLVIYALMNIGLVVTKGSYKNVVDNHAIFQKIINEGLYHVTTLENAKKILASGQLTPSNALVSYGTPKVFFFAGKPTYEQLESNCDKLLNREDMVAIKVKLSYEELALHFKERFLNDHALVYDGTYKLPLENVSISYLSVQKEDGKEIIVESNKPMKTEETRSQIQHNIRAYLNEFKIFGSTLKKLITKKWKLQPSTSFVYAEKQSETTNKTL